MDKVIQGTPKVLIDVFVTGLKTKDLDIFKVGEPSSITIRNVPVTPPMTVTAVQHSQIRGVPFTRRQEGSCISRPSQPHRSRLSRYGIRHR